VSLSRQIPVPRPRRLRIDPLPAVAGIGAQPLCRLHRLPHREFGWFDPRLPAVRPGATVPPDRFLDPASRPPLVLLHGLPRRLSPSKPERIRRMVDFTEEKSKVLPRGSCRRADPRRWALRLERPLESADPARHSTADRWTHHRGFSALRWPRDRQPIGDPLLMLDYNHRPSFCRQGKRRRRRD